MSDNNKLEKFIKEEVNKLHRITLLKEQKTKIERLLKEGNYDDMTEIFGFSSAEKAAKLKKRDFIKAVQEINNLTERDVPSFSKATNDNALSVRMAVNTIERAVPTFALLMPELFDSRQSGVEIRKIRDNFYDNQYPLLVPANFQKLLKPIEGGLLGIDLESIQDGLKKLLNDKFHKSSYGELY